MRRLALLAVVLAACAHASRSRDPANWSELQTEHFVLRTDLDPQDARRAIADLELVRAGLLAAGWRSKTTSPGRTSVVELASAHELREFAVQRLEGFVAADGFDEPIMVISADRDPDQQTILKHELAHVVTGEFLVSKPRWLEEGLACYLETLRFDRRAGKIVVGEPSADRLLYLKQHPVVDYAAAMRTGREAEAMDADAGYAFETAAWVLVHWLYDTRQQAFDAFLQRLGTGQEWQQAFRDEFVDLNDNAINAGARQYLASGSVSVGTGKAPAWDGPIATRRIDAAEVHALRADLLRLSPGYAHDDERAALKQAEMALALAADPQNPLALKLSEKGDAQEAVRAHPDDWRAWMLRAAQNHEDLAALAKAAELAPDNGQVLARLALAEHNAGKREQGLHHAVHAAEIAPNRSDVLDILAQLTAIAGKCDEAHALERRAIDALPDSAPASAVNELTQRLFKLPELCSPPEIARQVLVHPTQKRCARPAPTPGRRERVRGAITAEFTIGLDGTVSSVAVKGDAAPALLERIRHYVESCTYEPVLIDGKPETLRTTLHLDYKGTSR